jgi:4-hydroxy-3-polyprenylbenzoate decarboxylase
MGLNAGSKLVVAAAGPKRRELATQVPRDVKLPEGFRDPRVVMPGLLAIKGTAATINRLTELLEPQASVLAGFPLMVVVDDAEFVARSLDNFLWAVFTRSDPANDVHGVGEFIDRKHWGCRGPLVIDARLKPHMPPPLEPDPAITRRVDALFARTGPLHGIER